MSYKDAEASVIKHFEDMIKKQTSLIEQKRQELHEAEQSKRGTEKLRQELKELEDKKFKLQDDLRGRVWY